MYLSLRGDLSDPGDTLLKLRALHPSSEAPRFTPFNAPSVSPFVVLGRRFR